MQNKSQNLQFEIPFTKEKIQMNVFKEEKNIFLSLRQNAKFKSKKQILNYRIVVIENIPKILSEENLTKNQLLGQYGKINSIVITNKNYKETLNAYVTFQDQLSAALTFKGLNFYKIDQHLIETKYGTNRYCLSTLLGQWCSNEQCTFSHAQIDYQALGKPMPTFLEQSKYATNLILENLTTILGRLKIQEKPIIKDSRSINCPGKRKRKQQIKSHQFQTLAQILTKLLQSGQVDLEIYLQHQNNKQNATISSNFEQNLKDLSIFEDIKTEGSSQSEQHQNLSNEKKIRNALNKACTGSRLAHFFNSQKSNSNFLIDKKAKKIKELILKHLNISD